MWIVKIDEKIEILANNPDQYIYNELKKNHAGALFFRSLKPCINTVNTLLFSVTSEPGDLIDIEDLLLDEEGAPMLDEAKNPVINRYQTRGPSKIIENKNKPRLTEGALIVETEAGVELARFEIEAVNG